MHVTRPTFDCTRTMSALKTLPADTLSLLLTACTGIPVNVSPVTDFDVNRYLGTWYEIARLDHSFEHGLQQVTAEYSLRSDGGIRVVNQGFNTEEKRWERAEGKAYFIESEDIGRLKVSFFGPFYGAYNIIELDRRGYSYALVCGPDTSYLWILARAPVLDKSTIDHLLAIASKAGFDTSRLIFADHGISTRSAVHDDGG